MSQMKARRKQSDAKWRANLSSCYEILKHIMPASRWANMRQISKAIILRETAKHIDFLENMVATLLQEKAEKQGIKNIDRWCMKKVNQLQKNFVVAQTLKKSRMSRQKVAHSQKNLTGSMLFLCSGLDKETGQDNAQNRSAQKQSRSKRSATVSQNVEMTPEKNENEDDIALGFTPVKLPPAWYLSQTPSKNLTTFEAVSEYPAFYLTEENQEVGTRYLLCTERICLSDDEDTSFSKNNRTPKSKHLAKDPFQFGPRKSRFRSDDANNASKSSHSNNDGNGYNTTDNRYRGTGETMKCCRSLNMNDVDENSSREIDEEEMIHSPLFFVKLEDEDEIWTTESFLEETSLLQASESELFRSGVPLNVLNEEFEADLFILDDETVECINASLQCKDNSPMLSQTSEYTVNTDDQFYSASQEAVSVSSENSWNSQESPDYFALFSEAEIVDEADIGSPLTGQPEYPGQYSPLFGGGIAYLLGI